MLKQHEVVFKDVARGSYHILVRSPNQASDRFIGHSLFTAKPLTCKPKTANNPTHQFAGLVVSPIAVPDAFQPHRLNTAIVLWNDFVKNGMPHGYSLATGPWNGCLSLNGKLIHGDYDLLSVTPANGPVDNIRNPKLRAESTTEHGMLSPLVKEVMSLLNARFGCELVKHGAEFDADVYNFGMCDHFYPDGTHQVVTYTGTKTVQ